VNFFNRRFISLINALNDNSPDIRAIVTGLKHEKEKIIYSSPVFVVLFVCNLFDLAGV